MKTPPTFILTATHIYDRVRCCEETGGHNRENVIGEIEKAFVLAWDGFANPLAKALKSPAKKTNNMTRKGEW